MRYFTQAPAEDDAGRKGMPLDIATEETSHPEVAKRTASDPKSNPVAELGSDEAAEMAEKRE